MKTLDVRGKDFRQAFKQVRRWFSRNPNRKVVRLQFGDKAPHKNVVNRADYVGMAVEVSHIVNAIGSDLVKTCVAITKQVVIKRGVTGMAALVAQKALNKMGASLIVDEIIGLNSIRALKELVGKEEATLSEIEEAAKAKGIQAGIFDFII